MLKKNFHILALALLFVISCQNTKVTESAKVIDFKTVADSLAHAFIILDGHVDLPYRLVENKFDINTDKHLLISSPTGDFDFQRARKGGLDAPFMSIYIPASYQANGRAKILADSLIDIVQSISNALPDKFALANTPDEVIANFKLGKISLPMGMENGAPIEDDINNVMYFRERGIRYITLTHSKDNLICDSSYDKTRTWNGLSPFGIEVVKEMNRVGIMVDVSHISDSTFYQIMKLTKVPVIASHSSCRHFTPDFERNMSDDMIKLLAKNGGVIQINFGSNFLDEHSQKVSKQLNEYLKENNMKKNDSAAIAFGKKFFLENKYYSNVQKVADHIDHVVKIAGIDHVGLGSDFDGVGDTLPEGLKDVSDFPRLIEELLRRGYKSGDIEKICYKNVFRVWTAVEAEVSRKKMVTETK
jgi:membrane dipeptidase